MLTLPPGVQFLAVGMSIARNAIVVERDSLLGSDNLLDRGGRTPATL